ncbi:MAG: FUSC family protein [Acidimicrobiales bacterium]
MSERGDAGGSVEEPTQPRWRSLLAETTRLQPDQADVLGGLRCTVGVVIPLVIGLSTGAVADGLAAAVGALCAGFASFQGAYRSRAAITLLVAGGMAVATLTGALGARADWSAVVVIGAWALLAGMMTSLGQASLVIGLQWCVAVIIVNALPTTVTQAFVRAGMVLAGGIVQTLLVVVAWPIRSYPAERRAISAAYRDLAEYARGVAYGRALGSSPTVLNDARSALLDPQPFARAGQLLAFQALVDEAERIRIELAVLARLASRIVPAGGRREPFAQLASDTAGILRSVASAIATDEVPARTGITTEQLRIDSDAIATTAAGAPSPGAPAWMVEEAAATARSLAGQLRSIQRIAAASAGRPEPESFGDRPVPRHRSRALSDAAITLRANLSLQGTVCRHAVRLAATLMIATLIYRVSGLSHGYWLALTALLVLRQDFTTTAIRGVSRVAGTLVCAGLATVLVAAIRPDPTGLAVMFAAAACIAFIVVRVNYALFSICVTSYVVFLLAFSKLPALSTAGDRLIDTVLGGALAIVAYLLWPTWESRLAGPVLAELLDAQAAYCEGVLGCYAQPSSELRARLGELRSAARLSRSNAEASVERMAAEPDRSLREAPLTVETARGVIAAARRVAVSLLTLHSHLPDEKATAIPSVDGLRAAVAGRIRHNAADLRALVPPSPAEAGTHGVLAMVGRSPASRRSHPRHDRRSLRLLHGTFAESLAGQQLADERSAPLLISETDLLVDSVNTISELLDGDAPPRSSASSTPRASPGEEV